jgi:hypothetical protein
MFWLQKFFHLESDTDVPPPSSAQGSNGVMKLGDCFTADEKARAPAAAESEQWDFGYHCHWDTFGDNMKFG